MIRWRLHRYKQEKCRRRKKQDQCIAILFDNLKIDLSQEKVLPLCLFLFFRHITPISLNKKLNFKRSSHVL